MVGEGSERERPKNCSFLAPAVVVGRERRSGSRKVVGLIIVWAIGRVSVFSSLCSEWLVLIRCQVNSCFFLINVNL